MNRPKVNDYFPEDTDVRGAIIEYNAAPHLFKYVQALDNYIDSLLTPSADVQERAKDGIAELCDEAIELVDLSEKELNEHGFRQHLRDLVSSIKDGIINKTKVLQWVKASVDLPSIFDSHERHYMVNDKKIEAGYFRKSNNGGFEFEYKANNGMYVIIEEKDFASIEWLDESGASSLQAENERLREILKKVAHYNDGKKPYDYHKRTDQEQAKNDSFDDWQNIRTEINEALNKQ